MKNKVSVLLPAYNRPKYLEEAIESVLNQTFPDFELIISDDLSPVDLTETVKKFKDERIKFYRQNKNLGFIRHWNFCINKSSGEFIKIMGDDDLLLPDCLEKELAILNKHPDIGIVFSRFTTIDGAGKPVNELIYKTSAFRLFKQDRIETGTDLIKNYFLGKGLVGLPAAVLFRKSLLEKTGLFDEKAGCPADADMWIRMAQFTDIYYSDDPKSKMRWHGENLSKTLTETPLLYKEDFQILYKYFPLIKSHTSLREKYLIFERYARKPLGTFKKNPRYRKHYKQYLKDILDLSKHIWQK